MKYLYRVFRKLRVYQNDYFKVYSKILHFINEVAMYYNIKASDLRYSHFIEYCLTVLQYDIGYSTKKGAIAGLTLVSDDLVAIVINASYNVPQERVYFSLMHEIVHTILHIDENKPMQRFASVRNSCNAYETLEEIRQEVEADICASFLMVNEEALQEALKNKKTFQELRQIFNTSNSAMLTRLRNFLIYNANYSYQQSQDILSLYANNEITLEYLFPDALYDIDWGW